MKTLSRLLSGCLSLLMACSGGDGGEDPPPKTLPPPQAATLIFPENNSTCFEGEILSPSQSRVTFQWNEPEHTDNYLLVVKNLSTNTESNQTPSTNQATLTLSRGTPYQWYVVSRAQGTTQTATSATWRFYNEGPGITNYAPFPAEPVYPGRGAHIRASGPLGLEWTGADADGDGALVVAVVVRIVGSVIVDLIDVIQVVDLADVERRRGDDGLVIGVRHERAVADAAAFATAPHVRVVGRPVLGVVAEHVAEARCWGR